MLDNSYYHWAVQTQQVQRPRSRPNWKVSEEPTEIWSVTKHIYYNYYVFLIFESLSIRCFSLSLVIYLILKYIFSDINIATRGGFFVCFLRLVCVAYCFYSNLSCYFKITSCRQQVIGSGFFLLLGFITSAVQWGCLVDSLTFIINIDWLDFGIVIYSCFLFLLLFSPCFLWG